MVTDGSPHLVLRTFTALLVAIATSVVLAPAAGADGAKASNYRSVIDSVTPDTTGVQVRIVGGDSFIEVNAPPGTTVDIPGYDGEPYLRIDADGRVEQNRLSSATYLNEQRFGAGTIPDLVDSSADPDWETIADGGSIAWHDHRIHWMLQDQPLTPEGGVVQEWSVPLEVDGTPVTVEGRLIIESDQFPWAGLVALAFGAVAAVTARSERSRLGLLGLASVIALGLSISWYTLNPPGADPTALPVLLPALALLAVIAARFSPRPLRVLALPLGAVALLAGWAVQRIGVFWMPTLPTPLVPAVDRGLTATAIGLAAGVALAIMARPTLDEGRPPASAQDSTASTAESQSSTPPRS